MAMVLDLCFSLFRASFRTSLTSLPHKLERSNLVEIDNPNASRLAPASSGELLQHMLRENAFAGEFRAIPHQVEKCVLSLLANKSHVP